MKSLLFFIENEPPLKPRRKLLGPGPTPEWVFRPCIKMVKQVHEVKKQKKTAFELFPARTEGHHFFRRKCYFEERNDYYKKVLDKHNKLLMQSAICNNQGNGTNTMTGFTKQFFENVSNNKLLGVTITKDTFNNLMSKTTSLPRVSQNEYLKNSKNEWKKKEIDKISTLKMEQENLQRDINYVTRLKDRESEL